MKVIKRNGVREDVSFDKITRRIRFLLYGGLDKNIDPVKITIEVNDRIHDGISTTLLDEIAAEICIAKSMEHPDFATLAARIAINNYQKNTSDSFLEVMTKLMKNKDLNNQDSPLLDPEFYKTCQKYEKEIDEAIVHNRDYLIDYFGFKTLHRAYLMKINGVPIERIQHMWMRCALFLHQNNITLAIESYNLMSQKYFTHATPSLFHAGCVYPQMSSCYLLGIEDSIEGIYETITNCAKISKWAGGIGVHISNIRSKNALIRKTNGKSSGIFPMLKVFDATSSYVNQSGRRPGSFAMYLEPHHPDIFDFLEAKLNTGSEAKRARNLFYALWISDYFMECVEENRDWYLLDPDRCPDLNEVYGQEYKALCQKYVAEKRFSRKIKAREIWHAIEKSQIETGVPYICYKDAANQKSNQKNIGTIKSSNLCVEIMEYSDSKETAVCNLASINLSNFVTKGEDIFSAEDYVAVYTVKKCNWCRVAKAVLKENKVKFHEICLHTEEEKSEFKTRFPDVATFPQITVKRFVADTKELADKEELVGDFTKLSELLRPKFDFESLYKVTKVVTRNLNRVIDLNYYPTPETKRSNFRHRPIGIGVQGLADAFIKMKMPFDSEEARRLNKEIFETIYYGALETSMELSIEEGPYSTFEGSPLSEGKLQFDLWDEFRNFKDTYQFSLTGRWDFESLREKIRIHGVRNSLLLAPMPTASTAQILGNNEAFEPYTSNFYTRRTLAGEFPIINKHLVKDLLNCNLWNKSIVEKIKYYRGSIQKIKEIPVFLKKIYKTVWEIKQKVIIDLTADRGHYVCQSQSMNIFMAEPTSKMIQSALFYGWKRGLKSGCYYLRSLPASKAQQFTIDPSVKKKILLEEALEEEACVMCSA